MEKKHQINIWYFIVAIWVIVFAQQWWTDRQAVETIPYSEFQALLRDGKIEKIGIADQYIRGTLRTPRVDGVTQIYTIRVEPALAEDLQKYNVEFTGVIESKFLANLLSWIVPVAVFFALWMFVVRRFANQSGMGGFMTVGKSKAKI